MNILLDLAKKTLATSTTKGFDPPTMENLPTKLMFVITELAEAQAAATNGSPTSAIGVELADVALRLLGIIEGVWPNQWTSRNMMTPTGRQQYQDIEVSLWPILTMCCAAVRHWEHGRTLDSKIAIEIAIKRAFIASEGLGFDMLEEINAKMAINADRPHLHNKVRSAG